MLFDYISLVGYIPRTLEAKNLNSKYLRNYVISDRVDIAVLIPFEVYFETENEQVCCCH